MFDDQVSIEDMRTFWKGCVALFKGRPVFVIGIGGERGKYNATIKDLRTGEREVILLEKGSLSPPDGRLGFVNLNGEVLYTQRQPVRRFMMGVNDTNLRVRQVPNRRYERGEIHRLSTTSIEFCRTLRGEYPSLKEALNEVLTFGGSCAFDRQFAVDEDRRLFYKERVVGKVGRGAIDSRGIVLNEGSAYLKSVIGGFDYEEAARSVGKA